MFYLHQFAKYILLIFNFFISAGAITLIVVGIIYFLQEEDGVDVFPDLGNIFSLGVLAIIFGVLILFIAGFGCCGALHENRCLLTTYGIILFIFFIIQLALGIVVILQVVNEDDFRNYISDLLYDIFNKTDTSSIKTFYKIQEAFTCCGVANFSDYSNSVEYPSSCCGKTPCTVPFQQGCADAFSEAVRKYIEIIAYVALGFAVVEFLGTVLAFLIRRGNLNSEMKFTAQRTESITI